MTKEQKDKIIKLLEEERNGFTRDCNRRMAEECGKITGADYMFQKLLDVIVVDKDEEYEWAMACVKNAVSKAERSNKE